MTRTAVMHDIDLVGEPAPDGISRVVRGQILIDTSDDALNEKIQKLYLDVDREVVTWLGQNWSTP